MLPGNTWSHDGSVSAVLTPRPSNDRRSRTRKQRSGIVQPDARSKPCGRSRVGQIDHRGAGTSGTAQNPLDRTLPNGLRVIVQTENVSRTVQVFGQVRNDPFLQEPAGQEGVSRVMDALFSYGTRSFDRISFQQALDEIAADVTVGARFALKVPADRFDRGMELLADNLLHPAFPADAFNVVQQQAAARLRANRQAPRTGPSRELKIALYGKDDPSTREPSPSTISGLSPDDVRAYHRATFRPDLTTIVVIGKVTPDQALAVVQSRFGGWRASGPKPQTDPKPARPEQACRDTGLRREQGAGRGKARAGARPRRGSIPTTTRSRSGTTSCPARSMPRGSTAICARRRAWSTPWTQ